MSEDHSFLGFAVIFMLPVPLILAANTVPPPHPLWLTVAEVIIVLVAIGTPLVLVMRGDGEGLSRVGARVAPVLYVAGGTVWVAAILYTAGYWLSMGWHSAIIKP